MKLLFLNLLLWLSGQHNSDVPDCVADSAKPVIESCSSKETIYGEYSSKDAKDVLIDAQVFNLPDLLMEPLHMPVLPPLPPIVPINPQPVTDVNP